MNFLDTFRSWLAPSNHPAAPVAPMAPAAAPFTPDPGLSALTPAAPSLEVERYSDANYAVSRELEARKIEVMRRICAVNNAAAEDVIDRRGTIRRPAIASRPAAPLTAQEQLDAANLAEVTYVMENSHDSRF